MNQSSKEIERKFLIDLSLIDFKILDKLEIKQGYISNNDNGIVRVRISNDFAYLTIKGKVDKLTRSEFEYEIPYEDGINMLKQFCNTYIDKTRYIYFYKNHKWEIDVFHQDNEGLCVAEIELLSEDEVFEKPNFILEEVSNDYKYFNNNLLKQPYKTWTNK